MVDSSTVTLSPIIPDYAGANLRGIVPALLGPGTWTDSLPSWFPEPVAHAEQVILLILDGLGWQQLEERRTLMPTLTGMVGGAITSVVPTTTATALSSISTGLTPAEHGLLGYRMMIGGDVLNVLRWSTTNGDGRRTHPPREVQPYAAFLGHEIPVVSPADLQGTAFTEAHLRGSRPVGWRSVSAIAVDVGRELRAGQRFVYAYYGGIDKTAHERGFGEFYDAELRFADRLVADVLEALPPGAVLLVTADHGQVDVGDRIIDPAPDVLKMVAAQSGEGRFRWLHALRGATDDLLAAGNELYGDQAWIVSRQQMVDERWFGPALARPIAARLGDVALVAHQPVSFYDPADSGPFELVCRHGSLTAAEMLVPFVAAAG